MTQYQIVCKK